MERTKIVVLDTNVLLFDPSFLKSFEGTNVVIPIVVLEELDKHKTRYDEVGRNAREVCRTIDSLRVRGNLHDGIVLDSNGSLRVVTSFTELPSGFLHSNDNAILASVLSLKDQQPTLVTRDINLRLKCDALGIQSQDYVKKDIDVCDMYTGVSTFRVSDDLIQQFVELGEISVTQSFNPNEIVVLRDQNDKTIGISRCNDVQDSGCNLRVVASHTNVQGLKPRNKEQTFALDLLLDPAVKLVTLMGKAGCGKTLLAIAAGLHQLKTMDPHGTYEKLVVTRPIQPMGKDLGFLPGTLEEKLDPWIAPIRDNINFLVKNRQRRGRTKHDESFLKLLMEQGLVEIEALTYIRGRSIPNSFIIVDEAQNLTIHELKTIVTRVGEGTKVVLTGDIEQIDNVNVDICSNALSYAVEKFRPYPIAGHVTLLKGERSELASLGSRIL